MKYSFFLMENNTGNLYVLRNNQERRIYESEGLIYCGFDHECGQMPNNQTLEVRVPRILETLENMNEEHQEVFYN